MPRRCDLWRVGIVQAPVEDIARSGLSADMAISWLDTGKAFTFPVKAFSRPLPALARTFGRTPWSSAFWVLGPTTPSRRSPAVFCTARIACWVVEPNLPSALPFQ